MTGEAKPLKEDVLLITLSERRGHGIPQRATGGSTKVGQKVKKREKAWLRNFMAFSSGLRESKGGLEKHLRIGWFE